ncbi:MAG TPA: peptide deformylase [Panacibacter sp.]|nr:peptide deformylase [Panacibacter sp.]HNP43169.1 peptide deformylase [Panacibacter sp.]
MTLPIVAYGANILRKTAADIAADYPGLDKLIADMWETMYYSNGVGLAAPQINKDVRLFVVDSAQIFEHQEADEKGTYPDEPGIKKVFINAHVVSLEGEDWVYNEGCLSIPKIREDVVRPQEVTLEYLDEHFQPHTETFIGLTGRIIQHEYDHIDGKLFIDYLKPLRRKMLQGRLADISKGKVQVDYKMLFPK